MLYLHHFVHFFPVAFSAYTTVYLLKISNRVHRCCAFSHCCLCHASEFLAKPPNCTLSHPPIITLIYILYLLCASTRVGYDFLQHFSAIWCLLVLSPPKSHGPNLWELMKSSHLVRETCQCARCARWPDLGGEDSTNKMTYLPPLPPPLPTAPGKPWKQWNFRSR